LGRRVRPRDEEIRLKEMRSCGCGGTAYGYDGVGDQITLEKKRKENRKRKKKKEKRKKREVLWTFRHFTLAGEAVLPNGLKKLIQLHN